MTTALVGGAGLAGVLARYGLTRITLHTEGLVWTTVGINVLGSFLLGLLAAERWLAASVVGGVAAAAVGFALGRKLA